MKVSLIVPAYNAERFIAMTLESVKNQTSKSFECIVVDDFSQDNTKEVIMSYVKMDKRFKLISHRANAGLSAARNTGLRFAKGEYVAFLDADDLLMKDSLELRSNTLNKSDSKVIGTYSGTVTIDMGCQKPPEGKSCNLKIIDFITAGGNCPFNANQPMFKKDLFMKFGGFDQSLKQAEDFDMWMRILRYGYKFIPTNKELVTYRQTEGSMIKRAPLLHLDTSYKRFMDCFSEYSSQKFSSKFDCKLSKGLGDYIAELNIANRVLEFIGLGMASGESERELLIRLKNYLPNYFDIIESHRPFKARVKKGLDRYFKTNVDFNTPEYEKYSRKIDELYSEFKNSKLRDTVQILEENNDYSFYNIVSLPGIQEEIPIIFFPHKDYHVYTISLMKKYFDERKIKFIIVDNSMHYRDEGLQKACEKYELPYIGYSNFVLGNFKPRAIVVFNDWDPINRSILFEAKKIGIPTIGIVEGIQDYLDMDTKQDRKAYQVVDHLFLPGEHDKKYFGTKQSLYIGGIPRIYELYNKFGKETSKAVKKVVLINSNFSYGVLEECRDLWLTQAVETCQKAGFDVVISRHPADKGELYPELVTSEDFYTALLKSDILISRFASGILEALAVNVLPIYFNPHGEKVDKFKNPIANAYPVVTDKLSLEEVLTSLDQKITIYQQGFKKFLEYHCGSLDKDMSKDIVMKIDETIEAKDYSIIDYEKFYDALLDLDHLSGCFNNLQILRKYNENIINNGVDTYVTHQNYSLELFQSYIRSRNYSKAKVVAEKLYESQPNNFAYKSALDLVKNLAN